MVSNKSYAPIYIVDGREIDFGDLNLTDFAVDKVRLLECLLQGYVTPPNTIFSDLKTIAPLDKYEPEEDVYHYTLYPSPHSEQGYDFCLNTFESKLKDYWNKHFDKGEKVSILFSGGKDSTSLAYSLKMTRPDLKVKLFFLNNVDEYPRAQVLAEKLGFELVRVNVDFNDVLESFKNAVYGCGDLTFSDYYSLVKEASMWSPYILDGGGNDSYSGYLQSKKDNFRIFTHKILTRLFHNTSFANKHLQYLAKPRFLLTSFLYHPSINHLILNKKVEEQYKKHIKNIDSVFSSICDKDLKVNTRGRFFDNYQIYTKAISLPKFVPDFKVLFPFTDHFVASYIHGSSMKSKHNGNLNKTFLRNYLNQYVDYEVLDGGKQGMPSSYILFKSEIFNELISIDDDFINSNIDVMKNFASFAYLTLSMHYFLSNNSKLKLQDVFL